MFWFKKNNKDVQLKNEKKEHQKNEVKDKTVPIEIYDGLEKKKFEVNKSANKEKFFNEATINPYLYARFEWNELYNSFITAKNSWRLIAVVSMVLNIFCISATVYEALQVKYKVFWATENAATHSLILHKIDPISNVSDAIIVSQLQEFIVEVKTVLSDGFLMKKWNKKQASLCSDAAYKQLRSYWQLHDPFDLAMSQSIEVQVNSVMRIPATKDSWEIHWTEIHLDKAQGQEVLREQWSAILQVGTREIKKDEDLINNPSGINIESFTWQKVL